MQDDDRTREQLIEELKELRQRLSASDGGAGEVGEKLYLTLVENSPEQIVRVDRRGRWIFVNRAAAAVLAQPVEALVGKSPVELGLPYELIARAERAVSHVFETGEPLTETYELPASGGARTFETNHVPERDAQGEVVSMLTVSRDVTENRLLQAQLAQADRLSNMGLLAAGVAHEINNPLSYLLFNLEEAAGAIPALVSQNRRMQAALGPEHPAVASQDALDPDEVAELPDMVGDALEGAQRIRSICRTLRTFARVEHEASGPVDVAQAIRSAYKMANNELKFRATPVIDLQPTPPVFGLEGKLSQVLLNLLVNAARAIPEGAIEDNIIRTCARREGDRVVVEVSDTGQGIPPDHRDRIFVPFFTTGPVGENSGLGLSISQKIIEDMGGEISFESAQGEGTTFRYLLPTVAARGCSPSPLRRLRLTAPGQLPAGSWWWTTRPGSAATCDACWAGHTGS